MLDLRGYARAAKAMGHDVTVYGPPGHAFALDYSQDLAGAEAVVFVFEWTTALQFGDRLDWARLLSAVPRQRRVVIDCDGGYNDPIEFAGDYNHRSLDASRRWVGVVRQPLGQDLPADAPPAADECSPVPVSHLRPNLGERPRLHRQGVRHDLRRPHQVPLAWHVASAAGDRAGA